MNFNKDHEDITIKNNNQKCAWHLLQCKSREEYRASTNLANQGFITFLPEIKTSQKTKSGFTEKQIPLFPGYLFIKLDSETGNWSPIRSTRGVSKLVTFGLTPAVVPDRVIESIMHQTQKNNVKAVYPFNKGDKVVITNGPFKDLQAVFESRNGQQRAWIFLELMGKWQKLIINDIELNKVA